MLQLLGNKYPVASKQERHTRVGVTGETLVLTMNIKGADIPEDKMILWEEKGYKQLNVVAAERCAQTGEPFFATLKKVAWFHMFNQPRVVVLYVGRTDATVLGMIKFMLTHGTTVVLTDKTMQLSNRVLYPVTNLYTKELFMKYKIEELDLTTLKRVERLKAKEKLQTLRDFRNSHLNNAVWPMVNQVLHEVQDYYREEDTIKYYEFLIEEANWELDELSQVLGYETPDRDTLEKMIQTISHWGPAFGISAPTPERINTIDAYHDSHEFKHQKGWKYSRTTEMVYAIRYKQKQIENPAQLLKDYETILWFLDNDPEQWLDDNYYICDCGQPVHRREEACVCGIPNYNPLPDAEHRTTWEFTQA